MIHVQGIYTEFLGAFWWDHATCTGNLLGVFGYVLFGSCYMYREFIRSFWLHSVYLGI